MRRRIERWEITCDIVDCGKTWQTSTRSTTPIMAEGMRLDLCAEHRRVVFGVACPADDPSIAAMLTSAVDAVKQRKAQGVA